MRSHRRQVTLLAFVVPALTYVVLFFAYPLIFGFTMSVEQIGFIGQGGPYIGLHNYRVEINDPVTREALTDTTIFLVASLFSSSLSASASRRTSAGASSSPGSSAA